jgi:hypothetical protein
MARRRVAVTVAPRIVVPSDLAAGPRADVWLKASERRLSWPPNRLATTTPTIHPDAMAAFMRWHKARREWAAQHDVDREDLNRLLPIRAGSLGDPQ